MHQVVSFTFVLLLGVEVFVFLLYLVASCAVGSFSCAFGSYVHS